LTYLESDALLTLQTNTFTNSTRKENVTEGNGFLISHFEAARQRIFPRKMSTALTNGQQFTVHTVEQILDECEKAGFVDCRLNACQIFDERELIAPTITWRLTRS